MKKKHLLLAGALFFTTASLAFPLLGFALLEPSMVNLLFICWFFALSCINSFFFITKWLKERRFERDITIAFKQMQREEMKARFKQLDNQ